MLNVDTKSLLLHLNDFLTNSLQAGAGLCVARTNYEVGVEHFILKLLEDSNSDWTLIFARYKIEPAKFKKFLEEVLEDYKTGNSGKPVFSPILLELISDAWMIASIDLGDKKIRSGAILLALLARSSFYASGRYMDVLKPIDKTTLINDFWNITKFSVETKFEEKETSVAPQGQSQGKEGFLAKYCEDFTQKAKDGNIDPVFGRDNEIRQAIDILARKRKNNPICVGEPGVGKTALVEGLALRITQDDTPDILKNVTLVGLDMGLLEAGAGMKGEFENRLKGVITEIKQSEKPIILFIDEAHTLIGAGGTAGGSDAANLLKPALARGELKTIAATTWSEYKKYFEKDPALARRFQLIKLDEPDIKNSKLILRGLKQGYEKTHKVIVTDEAIEACVELSDRYISGRFLPDKAIDLLDTGCARIKINLTSKPPALEDLERGRQALDREKKALERDQSNGISFDESRLKDIDTKDVKLKADIEKLHDRWINEQDAVNNVLKIRKDIISLNEEYKNLEEISDKKKQRTEADKALMKLQGDDPLVFCDVTPDVIAKVVADWTGIPLGKMLKDEAVTIIHLEEKLKEHIKGQDVAIAEMVKVIKAAKAGIKPPEKPMGVLLFAGPSGVGKTETGLMLAEQLFGSEKNVVSVNMSEFQESHTVSRLIGSPPGYVGYGEGGMLTEAVRQKPYSVVLLDEVEKAHIDVINIFYQVFDKGVLTDGEGKEINFKNTIIILTSNLASDVIEEMTKGEIKPPIGAVVSAIRPILSQHFKPALLARTTVIPYFSLSHDAMSHIVELKLNKLKKTLYSNNKIKMTYTKKVVTQITDRCTEVETGARNIEYIIDGNVLPQLSQTILAHMSDGKLPDAVTIDIDKNQEFKIVFK